MWVRDYLQSFSLTKWKYSWGEIFNKWKLCFVVQLKKNLTLIGQWNSFRYTKVEYEHDNSFNALYLSYCRLVFLWFEIRLKPRTSSLVIFFKYSNRNNDNYQFCHRSVVISSNRYRKLSIVSDSIDFFIDSIIDCIDPIRCNPKMFLK